MQISVRSQTAAQTLSLIHICPVEDESLPAPTATDSMAVTVLHAGADTLPLRFWSIDDPYLYTCLLYTSTGSDSPARG